MRSKLFVPGSRPELFGKAWTGDADAVSIDLEDAVAEHRKGEARAAVAAWLDTGAALGGRKILIVRSNAVQTPHFEADLATIVRPGLQWLNLPKTESVDSVRHVADALDRLERQHAVAVPVRLLLSIESPRSLRLAHELAGAHPRVAGLQLALGDLFEPLGIHRRDGHAVRSAMFALRLAAGEAGVFAYDAAFADVGDSDGFRAEAEQARALGFLGKSCIHPSQVPIANAVFRPNADEIARARRIVDAAEARPGAGALVVDGQMIDRPFVERARAVLAATGTP